MVLRPARTRGAHNEAPASPRQNPEQGSSEETHSISSSFSDLDGKLLHAARIAFLANVQFL